MKPWEKYASKSAPSAGPWNKYKSTSDASALPEVNESMPDFVTTGERLTAKNFAQSPEKQLAYLQQQHPDKEFRLQDGEVIGRSKGDAQWGKVDPSFSPISHPLETLKDLPADIGDIGYDVGAGALQGLATAGGAIGGAFIAGAGAIPGAMAASGASSAGLEALRQKLGQWAGIPQEVNGTDVAITGAAGALSPLLFGAGKTTTGIAANLAKKVGASDALLNTAENGGIGVVEHGWDWAKKTPLPWIGGKLSGVSPDSMRALSGNMDMVDNLEKNGVTDYITATMNKVNDTLKNSRGKAGKAVSEAMQNAGQKADIEPARQVFQSRIDQIANMENPSDAAKQEAEALKNLLNKYFANDGVPLPSELSGVDTFDLQQRLKPISKFGSTPGGAKSLEEQQAMLLGNDSYHALNQSLDKATDGLSTEAKNEYARHKGIEEALGNSFEDQQKTFNTMTGLDKKGKTLLKEKLAYLANNGDLDVTKEAEVLQNYKDFANPSYAGGLFRNPMVQRMGAGGTIGAGLGYWAGANSGMGQGGAGAGGAAGLALGAALTSPTAMRAIIRANMNGGQLLNSIPGGAAQAVNPVATKVISPWLMMKLQGQ